MNKKSHSKAFSEKKSLIWHIESVCETQQATEVVESPKNVSRLNLEIEFRFNQIFQKSQFSICALHGIKFLMDFN